MRFHDEAGTPETAVTELFVAMMEGHLAPLIAALAGHAGLAPKLLWSNVAGYFEWIVQEMHRRRHEPALAARVAAIDEAVAFFERPTLPSGARNPLLKAVRYVEEGGDGWCAGRRICCLRNMLRASAAAARPVRCRKARRATA